MSGASRAEDEIRQTPQQYTQRNLGYVEGQRPLEVLATAANKMDRLIKGVPFAGHDINHLQQIEKILGCM